MPDRSITTVLHVAKTHLDVGFTAHAADVRRRYLEDFFPRAIASAAELRELDGDARLRWTTGAWILAEALSAATGEQLTQLEAAVERGDLCWHAMPFTTHTELADRSLFTHGLTISAELDRRFGRRTRAAKMTDVPGHTRGLVPVLASAGIDFLHIGVNPAATAPSVPRQFRWFDEASCESVDVMYQPASYGDVQRIEGTGVAVFVDLTGDNLGPPDAASVIARFAELAERFPNAEIRAATLDDVADVVRASGADLPVVRSEIGDTWVHGVASDPPKVAAFRELSRLRRRWIDSGAVAPDDAAFAAASTRLLLVAEHTWGMDQKTHWPDEDHWSVADLAPLRSDPAAVAFEQSWAEQRRYLVDFCDLLAVGGHAALAAQATEVLRRHVVVGNGSVGVAAANTSGRALARGVDRPGPISLGDFRIRLNAGGAIESLVDGDGRDWASPDRLLGQVRERTFDAEDFEQWFSTYNGATEPEDEWWARWDNTKPGLERSGARSRWWQPTLRSATVRGDTLEVALEFERSAGAPLALDPLVTMSVRAIDDRRLEFVLRWRRSAARWPEATWWTFDPSIAGSTVDSPADGPVDGSIEVVPRGAAVAASGWRLRKFGEWVDPTDIVEGGARLHVVEQIAHSSGVSFEALDAPLAAADPDDLLRWHDGPQNPGVDGWSFCLQANLWGTNFPMWVEDPCSARVVVDLGTAR